MAKNASLVAILNALPKPSVVLNDASEVIYSNHAARALIAADNNVTKKNKCLMFNTIDSSNNYSNQSLEILSSITATAGLNTNGHDATVCIQRFHQPALVACISPLENVFQNKGGSLVVFYDPVARQLPTAEIIAEYFSLSPAEASLCEDLVAGLSLKDIAKKTHKSEVTLRSYLKQVYQKTGFRRQGQLVSGVLSALMK